MPIDKTIVEVLKEKVKKENQKKDFYNNLVALIEYKLEGNQNLEKINELIKKTIDSTKGT